MVYRLNLSSRFVEGIDAIRCPEKKKTGRISSTFNFLIYRGNLSMLSERTGFWNKNYDFQALTSKYPEEMYLLTLAVHDLSTSLN